MRIRGRRVQLFRSTYNSVKGCSEQKLIGSFHRARLFSQSWFPETLDVGRKRERVNIYDLLSDEELVQLKTLGNAFYIKYKSDNMTQSLINMPNDLKYMVDTLENTEPTIKDAEKIEKAIISLRSAVKYASERELERQKNSTLFDGW